MESLSYVVDFAAKMPEEQVPRDTEKTGGNSTEYGCVIA